MEEVEGKNSYTCSKCQAPFTATTPKYLRTAKITRKRGCTTLLPVCPDCSDPQREPNPCP